MAGIAHKQSARVAHVKPSTFGDRLKAALGGVVAPVDYSGRAAYRRPPALYRHLQWVGWFLASRGWVPDFVVMLEVRGRRSGKLRRTLLVRTVQGGRCYLVALAGEFGVGPQRESGSRAGRHPAREAPQGDAGRGAHPGAATGDP